MCPAYHFSKNKTVIKCILGSQDVRNRHLHIFSNSAKAVAPTAALPSAAHSIPGRTIIKLGRMLMLEKLLLEHVVLTLPILS